MFFTYKSVDYEGNKYIGAIITLHNIPPSIEYYEIDNFGIILKNLYNMDMLDVISYMHNNQYYVRLDDPMDFCTLHYLLYKLCKFIDPNQTSL